MKTSEVVDLTYGDPMVWQLLIDGAVADLSAVTRWILYLKSGQGNITIDSNISDDDDVFDASAGNGKITIDLRKVSSVAIPVRNWVAHLVSFDPTNISGVLWGDKPVTTINVKT